jgi:hypothetical protein
LHLMPAVCGSFVPLRYAKPPQPPVISAFPLSDLFKSLFLIKGERKIFILKRGGNEPIFFNKPKTKKMKTYRLLFLTVFFLAFIQSACDKGDVRCTDEKEFCAFINSEEYDKTGELIDKYLSGLESNLSEEEQLDKLNDWLECKSCVESAEILCVSCIYTNPPQSEISVSFVVNGQQTVKTLDVIMDNPLRVREIHD